MKIEEIIKDLDPVTLIEFKNYLNEHLTEICNIKSSNALVISNNSNEIKHCEICGSIMYKNGKTKTGVQKYICHTCKHTSSQTTNTITYNSKLSFDIWKNIINNLLDGLSIRRMAEENNISIPTSFSLRHKVLLGLNKYIDNIKINKSAQSDEKYFKINLKGTKTKKMPRYSKKRTSSGNEVRGISHHKVCVISVIDEEDNLFFEIGGLGRGTTKMLEDKISPHLGKLTKLNTDSASSYQEFCRKHNIDLIAIPSGFYSNGEYNIAEINGVHSQLETWLKKFRGISTRHLKQYLNWFAYIFMMKKRFNLNKLKTESYKTIIIDNSYLKCNDIFKIPIPIDLHIAYSEYNL